MQKETENNISRIRDAIKDRTRTIKFGGFASALTSVAGASLLSSFSFQHEIAAASAIGATGAFLAMKFLFDKLKIEGSERNVDSIITELQDNSSLEQRFNDALQIENDKDLLRRIDTMREKKD